jgi:hypothetical protein
MLHTHGVTGSKPVPRTIFINASELNIPGRFSFQNRSVAYCSPDSGLLKLFSNARNNNLNHGESTKCDHFDRPNNKISFMPFTEKMRILRTCREWRSSFLIGYACLFMLPPARLHYYHNNGRKQRHPSGKYSCATPSFMQDSTP